MSNTVHTVSDRIRHTLTDLTETEHRMLSAMLRRSREQPAPETLTGEGLTFGERLADRIAAFGGSWTFIILFIGVLIVWTVLNTWLLSARGDTFDPYPFILLNLVLSMLAALQAPVILMSQNRQAAKDRQQVEYDFAVDTKAEMEIMALHQKLDDLREDQWRNLVAMQQEQIALLTRIVEERGGRRPDAS